MNWFQRLFGNAPQEARTGADAPAKAAAATPAAPATRPAPPPAAPAARAPAGDGGVVAPHAVILFGPVGMPMLQDFALPIVQKMQSGHVYVDPATAGLAGSSLMVDPAATLDSTVIVAFKPRPAWLARGPAVMQNWSPPFERALQDAVRGAGLRVRALSATYSYVETEDLLITTIKAASLSCRDACGLARAVEVASDAAH